jgi:hypothetical protein
VQYFSDSKWLMDAEEQKALRPARALNTRGRLAGDPRERNASRRGLCIARYRKSVMVFYLKYSGFPTWLLKSSLCKL